MKTTSAATSGSPIEDGGDAGDGQRQVGADLSVEQAVQGAVQDASPAEDRGDQSEAIAEQLSAEMRQRIAAAREPVGQRR